MIQYNRSIGITITVIKPSLLYKYGAFACIKSLLMILLSYGSKNGPYEEQMKTRLQPVRRSLQRKTNNWLPELIMVG